MIFIAISVIMTGLFLISLGVWILFHLPDPTPRDWTPKECTMMRCVKA